jgi:nucleotide-binding universal stress UspA family protein
VGTDGSAHGDEALHLAAALPLPAGAATTLIHVLRPQNTALELLTIGREQLYHRLRKAEREERVKAEALLEAGRKLLERRGQRVEPVLRTGDPASEILAVMVERKADLVIVGARGASLIEGLLTGSVADRLLANAECSVLLARELSPKETAR